jgi:hypothetical protein
MNTDVMIIVQHLSRYLQSHPGACDTSAGIARWWIDADPAPFPVAIVEAALGWMSACGVVECSRAADGRVRYRRANEADEIDLKLDAMAADPQSVLPQADPKRPPRVH